MNLIRSRKAAAVVRWGLYYTAAAAFTSHVLRLASHDLSHEFRTPEVPSALATGYAAAGVEYRGYLTRDMVLPWTF